MTESRKTFKCDAEEITPSLMNRFNALITSDIFPDDLKLAIFSPINKSGDKTLCDNYSPILIQNIKKMLEKLTISQLESYLVSYDILAKKQAGLRERHSTQTSLLIVV